MLGGDLSQYLKAASGLENPQGKPLGNLDVASAAVMSNADIRGLNSAVPQKTSQRHADGARRETIELRWIDTADVIPLEIIS